MFTVTVDTEALADGLRKAEKAHSRYEDQLGGADVDWANWYALYMAFKLMGYDDAQAFSATNDEHEFHLEGTEGSA